MSRVAVYWLRRDLRLVDNPALRYACEHADEIVLAYIHAPEEEAPWHPGAASRWWLHRSLAALNAQLAKRGQRVVMRRGDSLLALRDLIRETGASLVTWNRLYEPAVAQRDRRIESALQGDGIDACCFNAALMFEPWSIQTQQGQPYKVFTPFWRACASQSNSLELPLPAPKAIPCARREVASECLDSLQLLPKIGWDGEFAAHWQPGEVGALRALESFCDDACARYVGARDFPAQSGTSMLSPHLHFGEIGPRQILAALNARSSVTQFAGGRDTFFRELGWREFAHHVLFHFPDTVAEPFDARFASYPWEENRAGLQAWQRGCTGIPIVDAGMRELWRTGYMHNRVRMLVASFLTKNLRIHWLAGARWFWDTLVDADLANNTLGWQWTAGCGTDAAPYFRIFNPVTQGERFDARGDYVRRFVPDLAKLPDKWIHRPWAAPAIVLAEAGVNLGDNYPAPLVDLKSSRELALAGYKKLRV